MNTQRTQQLQPHTKTHRLLPLLTRTLLYACLTLSSVSLSFAATQNTHSISMQDYSSSQDYLNALLQHNEKKAQLERVQRKQRNTQKHQKNRGSALSTTTKKAYKNQLNNPNLSQLNSVLERNVAIEWNHEEKSCLYLFKKNESYQIFKRKKSSNVCSIASELVGFMNEYYSSDFNGSLETINAAQDATEAPFLIASLDDLVDSLLAGDGNSITVIEQYVNTEDNSLYTALELDVIARTDLEHDFVENAADTTSSLISNISNLNFIPTNNDEGNLEVRIKGKISFKITGN